MSIIDKLKAPNRKKEFYRKNRERFVNPISKRKRAKKWDKIFIFLIIIIYFGIAYFWFYSGYFNIQDIEINGLKNLRSDEVEIVLNEQVKESRFGIFSQKNIIFFNEFEFINRLNDNFILKSASIEKEIPNKLTINIEESATVLVIVPKEGEYYYLNAYGEVLAETPSERINPDLSLIYITEETSVKLKDKIIDENMVKLIGELKGKFEQTTQIPIEKFSIPTVLSPELQVKTVEGWTINFDSATDPDKQLDRLMIIIQEKYPTPESREDLRYIDIRFGDKVYLR